MVRACAPPPTTGSCTAEPTKPKTRIKNGIGKSESAERSAETPDHQKINNRNHSPVNRGIEHRRGGVPEAANGLHAAHKFQKISGKAGTPAVVLRQPALHAALQNAGTVKAEIDQSGDGDDGDQRECGASAARTLFKSLRGAAGLQMSGRFEDQQTDRGDDGGGSGVENAFQCVNAEGAGNENFLFTGNQKRAQWIRGPAKNQHDAEAGKIHSKDIPEMGGTDVGLKPLPAERANGVANIDADDRE